MLSRCIELSLRHRFAVVLATIALALWGAYSFRQLPLDAFPDVTPVQVQVNTVAPALGPEEIERRMTAVIEQSLAGLPGLIEQRSISKFGLSQVTVVFDDRTDLYRARQLVSERIASVQLPSRFERPTLGPASTGLGEVFHYLLSSRTRSLAELRTLHDWVLRPSLRMARGVAEINAWGGLERRIEVRVDPAELQRRGLTVSDVSEALASAHGSESGGRIVQGGEAIIVQAVAALSTLADVERVVVASVDGVAVRVRDVATVVEGSEPRSGAVTADGRGEAVLGLGFMLVGSNSGAVSDSLRAQLANARGALPADVELDVVYERKTLVDQVLRTVRDNLIEGALLVIAVLLLLLGNLRAGLIVASVIPLSMLMAFSAMLQAGVVGSLMSLGAIDFGLVVDSSIISVENALRRMEAEGERRPTLDVIRDAAVEVRRPTLFGELIVALVYVPVLALEGFEGKLFRPMALTVLFALGASMVLSMTYVPAMMALLFRRAPTRREPRLVRWIKGGYEPVVRAVIARRRWVAAAALALIVAGAAVGRGLGAEFVPRLSEGAIVINTVRLASVSLEESARYGTQIERALLQSFPSEITRVWTRTGTAEVATDPMGVELSDVFITLSPRERWQRARTQPELVRAMQRELSAMPGMRMVFTQPIEMRVNEMTAGIRADVGVKVYGDDLEALRQSAQRVDRVLRAIPGSADVTIEQVTGAPVLRVEVDPVAVGRFGVPAQRVLDAVAMIAGTPVAELREGQRRFPIALRVDPSRAFDAESIGRMRISAGADRSVALAQLARIYLDAGPTTIQREGARRRIIVQCNVRGRDLASFVAEAERRVRAEAALPAGYTVAMGGQFEHLLRARARLRVIVPLSLALVFLLLLATYRRALDAARVFTGVPFAMVGGVFALAARGMPLSISAAVGFIAVSGVAVLGDMVLASMIRQEIDGGREPHEAIRVAAIERVRPVLMTATVAGLGFVPMALSHGVGAEVQRPLATVVIGGLLSSTALTLLVLPALYAWRWRADAQRATIDAL